MKKIILYISLISLIPILVNLYAFVKLDPILTSLLSQNVANSYLEFAARVESGELSRMEIASRIERMASGEVQIASGFEKIRIASYFWLASVFLIALLQGILIKKLFEKSHNKSNQQGPVAGTR